MKIFYDSENGACAVLFDKEDVAFIYYTEEGLEIHSCNGGKPVIEDKQLLFNIKE